MSEQTTDIMVRLLQGVVDGVENPENGIKKGKRSLTLQISV